MASRTRRAAAGSDGGLRTSAEVVAGTLPKGLHTRVQGEWHGVAPDVVAPVLTDLLRRAA